MMGFQLEENTVADRPASLEQVDVTTGERRKVLRSELKPGVAARGAELLKRALAGERVLLPDGFSLRVRMAEQTTTLLAWVNAGKPSATVVRLAIATAPDPASWSTFLEGAIFPEPPAPWVGVYPEYSQGAATALLTELQHSLVWAWIDRRGPSRGR